ncbi:MAG: hypothetical protein KatS3mg096_505 [Candidatus Parcubacteria bacterium]|nr:MAG: hypothetical protein KatS3mg093_445 [Candidatus Parcubacteria bacterium]GIW67637.1 MAG: hypothetical protein KatS3mg096_505 [Candidatus Parcubacteria bacterium]
MSNKINKISRSGIELFLDCPRCFWLDVKFKIKRPKEFEGAYIGSKYDPLLKNYFDQHRQNNNVPPEIEKHDLKLFNDIKKLKKWRGSGIEFLHPQHNLVYYGKIDDLLIKDDKFLVPFDFKTTISSNFQVYESYKRQLEIYGYLLNKSGEEVLDFGVLYVIKIEIDGNFEKIEKREIYILENLDYEKYDEILEELVKVYKSSEEPQPNPNCNFCNYFLKRKNLEV